MRRESWTAKPHNCPVLSLIIFERVLVIVTSTPINTIGNTTRYLHEQQFGPVHMFVFKQSIGDRILVVVKWSPLAYRSPPNNKGGICNPKVQRLFF